MQPTWCAWRGCGCSELLFRAPGRCPGALPSLTPRPQDTAPGAPPGWREGWAVPGLAGANPSRAPVASCPPVLEWSSPGQGKAPGLREPLLVPSCARGSGHGQGLDHSGGKAKPLPLPMESSRTLRVDRAVLTSGHIPLGELLRGSRSVSTAPEQPRAQEKRMVETPQQCLKAELLQHERWGPSFRAPPLTQVWIRCLWLIPSPFLV